MKCDVCGVLLEKGDEVIYRGQTLCEECYMDALSPAKTCDPWAVYIAKSTENMQKEIELTDIQKKILRLLEETQGLEPNVIAEKVGITPKDLEREIATLRHLEKVRGALKDGKKVICLW